MYTCRECEQPINRASEVCPYCGADLTAVEDAKGELSAGARRKQLVKRWLLWGTLVAAMWGFLWWVLPERAGQAEAAAEAQAVEALRQVADALRAYREASGKYPDSLDALSPEGLERVRTAAQSAQSRSYRIEYSPGPAETDGVVRTFTLLARPGHFGYRNFYMNESGEIRWTDENRPATAQDRPI
jgi:type II secretory pathway pseudopilin PulG